MAPTSITLIRHGEKPADDGRPTGVRDDGEEDEHALVVRGWQRAGALAALLDPATGPVRAGLRRPSTICCADYDGGETHHRVFQTVSPLAARLGLTIEHPLAVDQAKHLYPKVLAHADGDVLVCWEHQHIPAIASTIPISPDSPTEPPTAFPNRFDLLWVFTASDQGYRFEIHPQQLLAGDRPAPADD